MATKTETKKTTAPKTGTKGTESAPEVISGGKWYPLFLEKLKGSKPDEELAADYVAERRKSMAKARATIETEWTNAESAYRVTPGTVNTAEAWRSTHTVPITHGLVETAVAEFVDSNPDSIITNKIKGGEGKNSVMIKCFKHSQYVGDFKVEKIKAFRDLAIYGTVIWEEFYREDPRIIKEIQEVDPETGEFTYELTQQTTFNDVYGTVRSLWDIYVDDRADDFDNAVDAIRREVLPFTEFRRIYGKYDPVKQEKVKPGGETEQKEGFPKDEGDNADLVEVLHYYNQSEDIYWIVANTVLLNAFDNPIPFHHKKLPFARGVNVLMPHKFYGMGLPKIIEGVQQEIDTLRRMALDRSKLNLSKVFLTATREDLTDEDITLRPGKQIPVRDVESSVKPLEFSDTGASRYQEEDLLKEDARFGTGISNPSQAVTTGATATESAIVKEATLKRLRTILATNECLLLNRIGKLRVSNIQQFYQDPIKINKITGEGGATRYEGVYRSIRDESSDGVTYFNLDPADIRGDFEYEVQSYSTIPLSQALDEQRADQLYDRLVESPVMDRKKIDSWLIKKHQEQPANFLMENLDVPNAELAEEENAKMLTGIELQPTQNATPEHTYAHINYVKRYAWQIDETVDQIFTNHINGEMMPVSPSGMGGQLPPTEGQPMDTGAMPAPGGMGGEMPQNIGPIPGMEGGGNPTTPDMSFDQQLGNKNQSIQ